MIKKLQYDIRDLQNRPVSKIDNVDTSLFVSKSDYDSLLERMKEQELRNLEQDERLTNYEHRITRLEEMINQPMELIKQLQ